MGKTVDKSVIEMVLAHANLMDEGVALFHAGDYQRSIEKFGLIIDNEPHNWPARVFLAMCQQKLGLNFIAAQQFRYVQENCSDETVIAQAKAALQQFDRVCGLNRPRV